MGIFHSHYHGHGHSHGSHGHSHGEPTTDFKKMLAVAVGAAKVYLTAHLSASEGNELDIFITSAGAPFAISVSVIRSAFFVMF